MATQTLSFDGIELQPDVSKATSYKQKKRRYTDVDPSASSSSIFSASTPSTSAPSSSKRAKPSSSPAPKSAAQKAESAAFRARLAKYSAVQGGSHGSSEISKVTNSALKKDMKQSDEHRKKHAEAAARAEILLPSSTGGLVLANKDDRTWRLSQSSLAPALDARTQSKMFSLDLDDFGPYRASYTRNGRHMLLAGKKGHLALMTCDSFGLVSELHVAEQVNDVAFLHDETMYAVAQKKYTYIYDRTGMELHCMRNHFDVLALQYLPYHYLLASVGSSGYLKYQDTSTGNFLCEHRTKLGSCGVMKQNPSNAVLALGHTNGTVTMWTPNMPKPVVSMLTHKAPVLALGIDIGGNMLVSSGLDGQVKVWDCRTYKELHSYFTVRPTTSIDVSDQGLLALGFGPHVQVWKDAFRTKQKAPYMVKQLSGKIVKSVEFMPFEDILGVGHSGGFSSLVIPGSGEANFDSFESNPFQTGKQRREHTVHSLLEKLQPDMITLEARMFGMMDAKSKVTFDGERKDARVAKLADSKAQTMLTNKARGKSKSSKKFNRKRTNIVDAARLEHIATAAKTQQQIVARKTEQERQMDGKPKSALQRFG